MTELVIQSRGDSPAAALVEEGRLMAYFPLGRQPDLSPEAILLGRAGRVIKNLEALFVSLPGEQSGYLPFHDIPGGELPRSGELLLVQVKKPPQGDKAASLTIMVGGSEATFAKVKPLFELMGKNITLVGGNGDGQTCKVANQIIVALNIEAVGEALLFASKAGADPAKVRQALMGGFASSRILEVHGERMINRTFNPGFRIELHQKDLNLALEGARALGLSLPHTASALQLMNACAAHGGAGWDHSGLVQALEIAANHKIAGN